MPKPDTLHVTFPLVSIANQYVISLQSVAKYTVVHIAFNLENVWYYMVMLSI